MYEAGHPKLVLWDNLEGQGGEGGGGGFRMGARATRMAKKKTRNKTTI